MSHVSVGASSTYTSTCRVLKEGKFPLVNEIHPGQCVIGDLMYMRAGGNMIDSCALTVLVTVMSVSHPDWVMIDAGYKTFGSESLIAYRDSPGFFRDGRPSFGYIRGRNDLWLGRLSAESSNLFYTNSQSPRLELGQRLEIIPNNATLVVNLHDHIYGVRKGNIEKIIPITTRGCGT